MDLTCRFCVVLVSMCLIYQGAVAQVTLTTRSDGIPILNPDDPAYTYTISATYSQSQVSMTSVELSKKSNPDILVSIYLINPAANATIHSSIASRVEVTKPSESADQRTTSVKFKQTTCDDNGTYEWKVNYYDVTTKSATAETTITVRVLPTFSPADGNVSFTPNTNLKQGDEVTFTCEGDIGNNNYGEIKWFYYKHSDPTAYPVTENITTGELVETNGCSYKRRSTMGLKLARDMNQVLVRCTVQQYTLTPEGDGYKQTTNIPMFYWPETASITRTPNKVTYTEGVDTLRLDCQSDSNPVASFYWIQPDTDANETVVGSQLDLGTLTLNHTGVYKCVAWNNINGVNYTFNSSVTIAVTEPTPAPTTVTTPVTTDPSGKPPPGSTAPSKDDDDSNIGGIIGGVIGGVVVVIVVVIGIVCMMRKKKRKEIEEPPEKPRNNQDFNPTFYGNRPDLVSSDHMKNNAHNSSFNNSFDSTSDIKPRDDGLLYIDLQFDNKPGSRRPIQVYDNTNGGTMYADVAMPRV